VTIRDRDVLVHLNEKIYPSAFINQAITDFQAVSRIEQTEDAIIISPKDPKDLSRIGFEFCNYVLGLIKNQ
jgi:hypothetical protein